MKYHFLVCWLVLFGVSATASRSLEKETVLANPSDLVILSDIKDSQFRVFLSYTGTQFNHCGVIVRGHSFGANSELLKGALSISRGQDSEVDISEIVNSQFVGKIQGSNEMLYGVNFTVKTKSGRSLEDVISELDQVHKAEVIIEILPCSK